MVSPIVICPGDTATVMVEFKNYGTDTLTSVTINWNVNNNNQSPYSWTGTLPSGGVDTVILGTYVFNSTSTYNLEFYTTNPNGSADGQTTNDSLVFQGFKTSIPAGTYTVGTASADYPSLAAASSDISNYGICGPVIFKVFAGTYTDHIELNDVNGASSVNTITFTSFSGDSTDVIINYAPPGTPGAVISLTDMSYVTVKSMTFNVTNTSGKGVEFIGNSSHNNILNNVFNLPVTTSSASYGIYANTSLAQYNTIANNRINGGYGSAYIWGSSLTNLSKGNVVENNIMTNFSYYGVYSRYLDSVMIRGNYMSNGSNATYPRAIYTYYCDGARQISGNTIHLTPSSYGYGIYLYYSDGSAVARGLVANNMISITTSSSSSANYGIYCYNSSYQDIYYNSINITAGSAYSRGFYLSSGSNINIKNNIFRVPNGITYYVSSTYAVGTTDYNDFYSNNTNFAYWGGYKGSLAALKAASGQDAHSLDVDPNFFLDDNLHMVTSPLDGKGTPVTEVLYDIDGDLRDNLTPDIGADEFLPPAFDITLIDVIAPTDGCGMTNVDVTARVRNTGSDTIVNTLILKYTLDSGATYVSENVTATILPTDTFIYTFNTQANIATTVDKHFGIWVVGLLPGDPVPFNDTAKTDVFNGMPPAPPTVSNATTSYATTATLTASSTNSILWFDSLNASTPVGVGGSYTTPVLFDTTVFYAAVLGTNGCRSSFAPVTVFITGIPAVDVGISELLVNEGCGSDTNEAITIAVYNQGSTAINGGVGAKFKVDNNPWIATETIPDTIGSGDTIYYTFTATANLKNYYGGDTSFSIEAVVNISGDPYHPNDSITKSPVVSSYTPDDPVVVSPLSVTWGFNAHLTASSPDSLSWFKTATDSVAFGYGSSINTSPLYVDTTFYVQAGGSGMADSIETIFTAGNSQNGNMFDIISNQPVTLDSFVVSPTGTGTYTVEVYYKQGTYVGSETSSSAWTLLGSTTINSTAGGVGNKVTAAIGGLTIPPNTTYGLYVTLTNGTVNYTNGNGTNQSFTDGVVSLSLGAGKSYPFASTFSPRVWNGRIYYSTGQTACQSNRVPLLVDVSPQPPVDAGMYAITSPTVKEPSNMPTPINVVIKNFGTNALTSVNIAYELDGVLKATYAWTGNIASGDTSAIITLYTDTFTGGLHHIRTWVSNANGTNGGVNMNDTMDYNFSACLSGVYTIGDTTSDFLTFADAFNAINSAGICGHVIFDVKPGTYNVRLALQPVPGMDSANTITFRSSTGDSTDVIIANGATASNLDYVVVFYGSSYYRLQNMTIQATGTSYARAIVFYNGAQNNIVENCVIKSYAGYLYNSAAVYFFNIGANKNNIIRNNHILNGYWGINIYSSSNYASSNNVIKDNIIEDFYNYGIYSYYGDSLVIDGNTVKTGPHTNTYAYGLYIYRGRNNIVINANDISMATTNSSYAMRLYYIYPQAPSNALLVSNNFVSLYGGTSTNYGIYSYTVNNANYYNNSVYITGGNTSSRAFYQSTGSGINIINNIFSTTQGGYAYYISNTSAVQTSDYNDIYTTGGTNYAYWNGNRANLAALKTASGKETHSLEVDPAFFTATNLHTGSVDLNDAGFALTDVAFDIDGEARSATNPDIGADEFTPPPNDASIISMDAPVSPITIGTNAVKVSMRNFGADTLTSATIAWQVNTVTQTPYSWSGSLPTGTVADSINIGSYTFATGATTLKFWPENPNNGVDGNHLNDTLEITVIGCSGPMHGTYTVGGSGADYPDISSAALAVMSCGVDSHVVFNITPGIYNEAVEITTIPGVADTATVTFQSSTSDSTDVVWNAASTANYTLMLNDADYLTFKHLTIQNQAAGKHTIEIKGGSSHNTFMGNILKTNSTSSGARVINSGNDNDEYNVFRYNKIINGREAVYFTGASSSNGEDANVFEYNEVVGFGYYAFYLRNQDSVVVNHNKISSSGSSYAYGIYLYYCNNGLEAGYNDIQLMSTYTGYGIRVYYSNATTTSHGRVYNNFISITAGTSSQYGLYLYNSKYIDVVYNNVLIASGGTYGRALYVSSGNNIRILNNNLVSTVGCYAYYVTSPSAIISSDYNNFYVTGGTNYAYWSGSRTDLAALQSASGKDAHSKDIDPSYYSNTDLHVTNVLLNAAGTAIVGITDDFDGDARPATPDIGADEFTPQQWDAAVISFNSPKQTYGAQSTSQTVFARIRNFGMDTITSLTVGYQYANGNVVTQNWAGTLLPGDTSSILFTTPFTVQAGTNVLAAFTMLTNDGNTSNDTLKMSYAGLPLIAPTYCDNFDGQNVWASQGTEWQLGVPQGSTVNTAHSAPNVWMTNLSGDYSNGVDEYLLSPFIDFSNVNSGATLKFWRNNSFGYGDGFNVEYSIDGGNTWATLGYIGDTAATNWYNQQIGGTHMFMSSSSGWTESTYHLTQFNQATTPVQFRFHMKSNSSGSDDGVAIDDFCIQLPPIPNDVGVVSISAPVDSTVAGSTVTVSITVKNFGTATQTSIPVKYTLNNGTPVTETMSIPAGLMPDSTEQFSFTTSFTAPGTDYDVCAYTALSGDIYTSNDKSCKHVIAKAAALDAAAIKILSPKDTCSYGANVVIVRIKNMGTTPMTSCKVSYYINSPSNKVTETWTGTLNYGDSTDYTFTNTFNAPIGLYQICALTELTNDADPSNDMVCKTVLSTGFDEITENGMKLWQNVPNPAEGKTIISYEIPKAGMVRFRVVDMLGQTVLNIEEDAVPGRHQIDIDAKKLSAGVYYYTMYFDDYQLTRKMIINH
jgi:hypothetical protein